MKKLLLSVTGVMLIILFAGIAGFAQDQPAGKVHGYVFGDYFYKANGDSTGSGSQYAGFPRKQSGFMFRRLYLYYDHTISENFQAQFLLEGNDKAAEYGEDKNGKPTVGRHTLFIKTAFLEWKNLIPKGSIMVGMVPTPTWSSPGSAAEKMWNYRSIEKTVADFRGLGSASDIGIMVRGKAGNDDKFGYALMVGNGNGQKPENNKSRKYYLNGSVQPVKGLVVEAYADYEKDLLNKSNKTDMSKMTLKGFAAYQVERFTVGVEGVRQTQKNSTDTSDVIPFGLAVFGWTKLTEKLNAFARFDMFDPDTEVTNAGYKENFITAGVDYAPHKSVHVMPNIWLNTFSKKSSGVGNRDSDVVYRVTFYYVYK